MAERLYKNKEDMKLRQSLILDDRHQFFNYFTSPCGKCKHFEEWDFFCVAFPSGIPNNILEGANKHNYVIRGQVGKTVFEKKY